MSIALVAALGAALCWAASGIISVGPVRAVGALTFLRLRLLLIFVAMAIVTSLMGGWQSVDPTQWGLLAASGLIGIAIGDSALFWALGRMGPRLNSVVFATNAPMTALLGWTLLDEPLSLASAGGILLVTVGVMMAVAYRDNRTTGSQNTSQSGKLTGSLLAGVIACLIGALCQAIGTLIAKPAMATGIDPVAASTIRVGTAALVLGLGLALPGQRAGLRNAFVPRTFGVIALSGLVGVGFGMTLLMVGLRHGDAGLVATLSATSPVLILPMLWAFERRRPGIGAWAGAGLAVIGVAVILNR